MLYNFVLNDQMVHIMFKNNFNLAHHTDCIIFLKLDGIRYLFMFPVKSSMFKFLISISCLISDYIPFNLNFQITKCPNQHFMPTHLMVFDTYSYLIAVQSQISRISMFNTDFTIHKSIFLSSMFKLLI